MRARGTAGVGELLARRCRRRRCHLAGACENANFYCPGCENQQTTTVILETFGILVPPWPLIGYQTQHAEHSISSRWNVHGRKKHCTKTIGFAEMIAPRRRNAQMQPYGEKHSGRIDNILCFVYTGSQISGKTLFSRDVFGARAYFVYTKRYVFNTAVCNRWMATMTPKWCKNL